VVIFGYDWNIADEVRLIMLVICAGALGSLVHGIRSVYWYVGNRQLVWSWIPKYLLQPFAGAILSVVFYFVVRGGFFSPQSGFEQTSPFGFAAMAAMVGLFSEQAVLKLQEIAETLLTKPAPGKNAEPQGVMPTKTSGGGNIGSGVGVSKSGPGGSGIIGPGAGGTRPN